MSRSDAQLYYELTPGKFQLPGPLTAVVAPAYRMSPVLDGDPLPLWRVDGKPVLPIGFLLKSLQLEIVSTKLLE